MKREKLYTPSEVEIPKEDGKSFRRLPDWYLKSRKTNVMTAVTVIFPVTNVFITARLNLL